MVLKDRLDSLGYEVIVARDGMQALEAVERETPRLMVLDLEMPRLSGIEVPQRLSQGKQRGRDGYHVPVIVMTAHGTIKKAVEAMREGAYDFVMKPIEVEHLIITIQKASERETLKRHYEVLRSELGTKYATIIGNSLQMKSMIESSPSVRPICMRECSYWEKAEPARNFLRARFTSGARAGRRRSSSSIASR